MQSRPIKRATVSHARSHAQGCTGRGLGPDCSKPRAPHARCGAPRGWLWAGTQERWEPAAGPVTRRLFWSMNGPQLSPPLKEARAHHAPALKFAGSPTWGAREASEQGAVGCFRGDRGVATATRRKPTCPCCALRQCAVTSYPCHLDSLSAGLFLRLPRLFAKPNTIGSRHWWEDPPGTVPGRKAPARRRRTDLSEGGTVRVLELSPFKPWTSFLRTPATSNLYALATLLSKILTRSDIARPCPSAHSTAWHPRRAFL